MFGHILGVAIVDIDARVLNIWILIVNLVAERFCYLNLVDKQYQNMKWYEGSK